MKTAKDIETQNTWNKIAQLYEEHFMGLNLYDDTYDLFCELLPKESAEILELGCGPGNITQYLAHKRPNDQILAVDYAPNMIELAQHHNSNVEFEVLDCRQLDQIQRNFDGIICGFILPYLNSSEVSDLIRNCSKKLNRNGILYLSFVDGDEKNSGFLSGSTGDRTYFYYHSLSTLKNELELNSFQIQKITEKEYLKSNDSSEIHNIIHAVLK